MTPLFASKSMGGAQKQLKKVALHLAETGHQVTVLCTYRQPDASETFYWHPRAQVLPILRFKQPFPEPYDTPIYNIANAIYDVIDHMQHGDAYYSHDGGLIFPFVHQHKPSTVSLRSVLFSETLQSGFLFNTDALIVPAPYTAQVWQATAGQFYPQLPERIHTILNGLDFERYHPNVFTENLIKRLSLAPEKYRYLLYPHRPDEAKGIRQTILLVEKLVKEYGYTDIRVLIPQWIDTGLAAHVKAYYDGLARDIAERGLTDFLVFHEWIGDDDMSAYFALGSLTLVLGNYVETFGNTPYESLACGTPALVANVGAYRGVIPNAYTFDYGDTKRAAEMAAHFLQYGDGKKVETLAWLHTHYQQLDMVCHYEQVILETPKQAPLEHKFRPIIGYQLAPWCYVTSSDAIYHDFLGHGEFHPQLIIALEKGLFHGDPIATTYRTNGWIVPIFAH